MNESRRWFLRLIAALPVANFFRAVWRAFSPPPDVVFRGVPVDTWSTLDGDPAVGVGEKHSLGPWRLRVGMSSEDSEPVSDLRQYATFADWLLLESATGMHLSRFPRLIPKVQIEQLHNIQLMLTAPMLLEACRFAVKHIDDGNAKAFISYAILRATHIDDSPVEMKPRGPSPFEPYSPLKELGRQFDEAQWLPPENRA